MSDPKYKTSPDKTAKMPSGIPFIIGNEAAERFSYYGMRTILIVFLTEYLRNKMGQLDVMTGEEAKVIYHNFMFSAYFFPVIGALISDLWLGKYRTIIGLSIVYCIGHLVLAFFETRTGIYIGLGLIAVGAGGIKPCVSAHVGDQFGNSNQNLLSKVFGWFYFSINFGAFISTLLTPWLLIKYGSHIAFGVPGFLMFIATVFFWLGRNHFVHIPAKPKLIKSEISNSLGLKAIWKLILMYCFIIIFWAVYDQNGSDWVLQAKKMDRTLWGHTVSTQTGTGEIDGDSSSNNQEGGILGDQIPEISEKEDVAVASGETNKIRGFIPKVLVLEPAQIQAANPILVLLYIPLFTYVIYPFFGRFVKVTASFKIAGGLFLTIPVLLVIIHVQRMIDAGFEPTLYWHIFAFVILTAAEVMIYQAGLEYTYTQAPNSLKSIMMSLYLLSIAMGNLLTANVNAFIQNADGTSKWSEIQYFSFFMALVGISSVLFLIVSFFGVFKDKTYLQDQMEA